MPAASSSAAEASLARRAAVVGLAGERLEPAEAELFGARPPLGFILFRRNCRSTAQVRALIAALHAVPGCEGAPVMIDQEGGRVARLAPPDWPPRCALRRIGELAEVDLDLGRRAAWLHSRLIAADLEPLGIRITCAPVLDLGLPEQTRAIGDRAYGADPDLVGELGAAAIQGFLDGGVLPVIKHLPGHGRATVDSHLELPLVDADAQTLEATDWRPFVRNRTARLGMTAHILFRALDADAPATQSRRIVDEVIRGRIGFEGLLFSDDLSMEALQGAVGERAARARAAGCDVALHCNGRLDEARAVLDAAGPLSPAAAGRLARALDQLRPGRAFDDAAGAAELEDLLARVPAGAVA